MRTCRKCGKPLPVVGAIEHVCHFVVGQLVRLPDNRTATVVRIQNKRAGEVVTVELPGHRHGAHRSFPTYLADALRWVSR